MHAWSDKAHTLELAGGFSLERADEREFLTHMIIYRNVDAYFWHDWDIHFREEGGLTDYFWLVKDGVRVGGTVLQPGRMVFLFLVPPYQDLQSAAAILTEALRRWTEPGGDIFVFAMLPWQVQAFEKLGFRVHRARRCMIRPTGAYMQDWDPECTVEPTHSDRAEDIARLFEAAYRDGIDARSGTPVDFEGWLADVRSFFARVPDEFLDASPMVFDAGGSLIGACLIGRLYDKYPFVSDIAVHPDWRGRGLGTKMLEYSLTSLSVNYATLRLFVTIGNPAESVYFRLGFQPGVAETVLRLSGEATISY